MKYLSLLLLVIAAGCSTPGPTQINRPAPDVNGTRTLILKTTFNPNFGETFARAYYYDGAASGFGQGVKIWCNGSLVIDTKDGTLATDTGRFITFSPGEYLWEYEGLDTSFSIHITAHSTFTITSPSSSMAQSRTSPITVIYTPSGECNSLHVILTDNLGNEDIPPVVFNSLTGDLQPVTADPGTLVSGVGTIMVTKTNVLPYSSAGIHSILAVDSSMSRPQSIQWR